MSAASASSNVLLCPSARCEEGALLVGIVQPDATVAFTPDEIRVDAAFVEIAHRGRFFELRRRKVCKAFLIVHHQRRRIGQHPPERPAARVVLPRMREHPAGNQ